MKLHLSWLTSLRFPKGQSTCSAGNMVEPEGKRADSPLNNLSQRTLATVSACRHTELVSYTCEFVLTNHDCKHLAQHSGSQCWKQLLRCFSFSGFGMINSNWPLATPSTKPALCIMANRKPSVADTMPTTRWASCNREGHLMAESCVSNQALVYQH